MISRSNLFIEYPSDYKKKIFFKKQKFLLGIKNSALFGVWNNFYYKQSCKNIFLETIQNSGKAECSKLEQRSVIKFIVAEKCKPCEIYRRMCVIYMEKHVLVKEIFTGELKMSLPLQGRDEKSL